MNTDFNRSKATVRADRSMKILGAFKPVPWIIICPSCHTKTVQHDNVELIAFACTRHTTPKANDTKQILCNELCAEGITDARLISVLNHKKVGQRRASAP